jgi:ATP-binding cassette, subfamily B, bacterial
MNPVKKLWALLVIEKKEITSIYFYAILGGLVQLSVPLGVQAIIGFVLGATMVTSIYILITLVVIGVLFVGVFQINQMKIIEKIQQNIFTRYAFEFAEKIPRFDLKKSDNLYLPEVINRFFDTISIQKGLSKLLLDVPTAMIQIFLGLVLLSFYHPIFIAFGFLLIFILWIILKYTSGRGLATSLKESSYKYSVVAWLEEMARVIKSFKFSQGTHLNLQKTDRNVVGYLTSRTDHFKILLFQYKTLVIFKVIITAAMLIVGTYLLLNQQINIGEFIASEIVILTVISAVEKLIASLDNVYDVLTGLEKLASVLDDNSEKDGTVELDTNNNGVAVEMIDFSFSYSDKKNILKNLNFKIQPNNTICISGEENSGKSTLLRILSGNYNEYEGSYLLNNIPIGNYQLETLREKTGTLLSQQDIFIGSVRENITMGRQDITSDNIISTAQRIGISDFLNTFREGLETEINPTGKGLSSSIVKKILLLRALAKKSNLLLLEEPWAGLDGTAKKSIMNYILNKLTNTTVFVISNDEDFISKCNFNLHLNNGIVTIKQNNLNGSTPI